MMERKRRSIPLSALMEFDSLGESSEDSDFRIEDHIDESNEEDVSFEDGSLDLEDNSDDDCKGPEEDIPVNKKMHEVLPTSLQKPEYENINFSRILICCVCLGDKNNDNNEIIECDCCGVTVHEDCYGISDNESISSTGSGSSKTSWFCEACRAGKKNLSCELCPNFGGIFKETDTGKWVHLVCALYIPGVAFRDVDKLSNVTLFEMSYSKWGERICTLCPDQQFAQTGVCIGCDAGLCRTYFHVTCAQKEGLLSEAQTEEMNHADPFYAHCRLHSDKAISKLQKRNWLAFELQIAELKKENKVEGCDDPPKNILMNKKLLKAQQKYVESKINRGKPWVPTQKMPRPLTSCASTLRALSRKASLSGIDSQALAMKEAHTNALTDVHRKWHISPAFNVEFMGYYLDRNTRISSLKQKLNLQTEENSKLIGEQRELQVLYNQAIKEYNMEVALGNEIKTTMKNFLEILSRMNSSKKFLKLCETVGITPESYSPASSVNDVKQQTVEVEGNNAYKKNEIDISENLCLKCVTCKMTTDQHLLVKCDTCQLYYHLSCLDPPLTRMPKKTKVMGWQCSECDKSSSDSDIEVVDTNTPRQLRQNKGGWGIFISNFIARSGSKIKRKPKNQIVHTTTEKCSINVDSKVKPLPCDKQLDENKKAKVCKRDSTGSNSSESQNVKQKSTSKKDCQKLFPSKTPKSEVSFSSITDHDEKSCVSHPGTSVKHTKYRPSSTDNSDSPKPTPKRSKITASEILCDTCKQTGTRSNVVTCDECLKAFHFHCLNPPVKKSPKGRGYSWHCADCDPSESDSD